MDIALKDIRAFFVDDTNYVADHLYLQVLRKVAIDIVGHDQPYYHAFYNIAKQFKPKLSVELGSWRAIASAHLAIGNPDGQVITIDIHKDDKEAQKNVIETCRNIPNLIYLNGWTWDKNIVDTVASVAHDIGGIDLLYIDAWHEYQYISHEWELYSPLLANPSLVIMDDIMENGGMFGGMTKFWDELKYPKFIQDGIHPGVPMGFLVYNK